MDLTLRRIICALLFLQTYHVIKGDKFPSMEEIFYEFFEAEVQITDINENQTAFATEYYDDSNDIGRVTLIEFGKKASIFYFREEGDILEVNDTACVSTPMEDSKYYKIPLFHGWLNKEPFVIGPSALLWFATKNSKDIVQKEKEMIRGISCDRFQLKYKDDIDDVTYDFYFAAADWTSPRDLKKLQTRIPIRIDIVGYSGQYGGGPVPIDEIIDFSYFWPIIDDFTKLEPPIGLGCIARESGLEIPDISDEFQFVAEEYDLMDAEEHDDTEVDYRRVFLDERRQLARMDKYSRSGSKKELHDFNTGVTYVIQDDISCKIQPLAHSFFEYDGELFQGGLKTAKQVLGLDGDFYYMGKRTHRGIDVEVYEKAVHSSFFGTDYFLVVTTVFFTGSSVKDVEDGTEMMNIPVYILVTTYDKPNNVVGRKQFNIFAYDDVVGTLIYYDFPVEDCFPLSQQRAYYVLIMKEGPEIREKIQQNNQIFTAKIKSEIMKTTGVSDLRLPFMKIDYETTNIFVTGLMIDRPKALDQFIPWSVGPTKASSHLTLVVDAETPEQCAYACVDKGITCGTFHFCGPKIPKKGLCFHDKDPLSKPSEDRDLFENCYIYIRAEMNSNNQEQYLDIALSTFSAAVENENFKLTVPLDADSSVELTALDVVIGEGPFDSTETDKSYKLLFNGYQLKPATENEVTLEREDLDTELDCYRACKDDEEIACQSFSYCPQSKEKQCRISESFLTPHVPALDIIDMNKECNVYSLMYLDLFEPNPGKVLMRSGKSTVKNIASAEECAMICKIASKFTCRGFEFCKAKKSCVLHSDHIMDVDPSEIVEAKESKCVHYSAKFASDYLNMGHVIIDDISDVRKDLTVEQCSRICSEDITSCKAFVYCPKEFRMDATCSLTDKSLVSPDVKTKTDEACYLYSKKDDVHDWGNKPKRAKVTTTKYTKRGFAGVVVGTLIFGLIVGVIAFLGFSYYKSRRSTDGMSVRFMKSADA